MLRKSNDMTRVTYGQRATPLQARKTFNTVKTRGPYDFLTVLAGFLLQAAYGIINPCGPIGLWFMHQNFTLPVREDTNRASPVWGNMEKYYMWIHYERLHNHNKAKHNKTVCIFIGIYCIYKSKTEVNAEAKCRPAATFRM